MKIKEKLVCLLGGQNQNPSGIAKYCKRLALAYLKKKVSSGNHYILNLCKSLEDLAWDCIADLFERDEQNNYVQFESYFADKRVEALSEAEIQITLRRLVFSKVNDGLFRNFGVFDMSLSKIIRNLKLAAGQHDLPVNRNGSDNYLIFEKEGEVHSEMPMMPPEFLEIKLTNRLQITMDTPEIVDVLETIITGQDRYQKRYPLVQLARVIRRAFININDEQRASSYLATPLLRKETLEEYLQQTLDQCEECFHISYVAKGKITKEDMDRYVSCIEGILRHHYVAECGVGDSYYDHFREVFPRVTKDQYRKQHRQYLEYMVKKVREELFQTLRKVI